jgi:hypothetical protein
MSRFNTILVTFVVTTLMFLSSSGEAFSLQMASSSSSNSKKISSTKLNYANSDTMITLEAPPKVSLLEKNKNKKNADPIKAIAFLNDPERKYKKRMRPRYLSDMDRERRAFVKAAAKAQANANFEFGQRAAERAIRSVLEEHNIQDTNILQ